MSIYKTHISSSSHQANRRLVRVRYSWQCSKNCLIEEPKQQSEQTIKQVLCFQTKEAGKEL
jgi:hypothetical protein